MWPRSAAMWALRRASALTACLALPLAGAGGCNSAQHGAVSKRAARVIEVRQVGPRLRDLTIDSPALGRPAKVRLLLPSRYEAEPKRRWPVLWLLHGCCDTYRSWTRSTDLESLRALDGVMVVMPEAGPVGFYSDWYNGGRDGPPRWETFHLSELRRLLESRWRADDRRAVAGVSMGGLGAMAYAARHRGMFGAAASYSGLLDTRYAGAPIAGPRLIQGLLARFGADPSALWGDPREQAELWAAHNPSDLAARLRGARLFVSAGDGRPGPLDRAAAGARAGELERAVFPQNAAFVERLHRAGIPVVFDAYGRGTHDWPYWQRELHRSLPMLLRALETHR